jgi:ubiquitin carboxyl-terminal hydrolase 10
LIVSSYPHSPPVLGPAHVPPPTFPPQPRSATSTPIQATMSPPPSGQTQGHVERSERPPLSAFPVIPVPNAVISSPPVAEFPKVIPTLRQPFRPPVSYDKVRCKPDHMLMISLAALAF